MKLERSIKFQITDFYDLTVEINIGFQNDLWIGQPSGKESLFFKALQLN